MAKTAATATKETQIPITVELQDWLCQNGFATKGTNYGDSVLERAAWRAVLEGALPTEKLFELCGVELDLDAEKSAANQEKAAKLFGGNKGGANVRVKDEREKFSSKRYAGRHRKSGEAIIFNGAEVEQNSQLDNAMMGVLVKHAAAKSLGGGIQLEPSERALLDELATKAPWTGTINDTHYDSIEDGGSGRVKALLDDTTSGGLYIAPVAVDERVVTFPLLSGEVFPYVDLQTINRGRRIEGASISNPTFSSGGADDANVPVFTTTSMLSQITATVFVENIAIEVGRDFLSDAIVDVGALINQLLGEAWASKLDYNCALGDGTTQPQGLFVASGITTITPDNTASGPPTLADYTNLMFGVGKAYRQPGQCRFLSNDTTFARSRQVRVDPHAIASTVNQLPVLSDVNSFNTYQTLGWGHSVQNDIANARCLFGNLRRGYRMWRRTGLEIEVQTAGKTLGLANKALVIARSRFAGKVVDASAFAKWTNGQS